jgi:hypothetical protein
MLIKKGEGADGRQQPGHQARAHVEGEHAGRCRWWRQRLRRLQQRVSLQLEEDRLFISTDKPLGWIKLQRSLCPIQQNFRVEEMFCCSHRRINPRDQLSILVRSVGEICYFLGLNLTGKSTSRNLHGHSSFHPCTTTAFKYVKLTSSCIPQRHGTTVSATHLFLYYIFMSILSIYTYFVQ